MQMRAVAGEIFALKGERERGAGNTAQADFGELICLSEHYLLTFVTKCIQSISYATYKA